MQARYPAQTVSSESNSSSVSSSSSSSSSSAAMSSNESSYTSTTSEIKQNLQYTLHHQTPVLAQTYRTNLIQPAQTCFTAPPLLSTTHTYKPSLVQSNTQSGYPEMYRTSAIARPTMWNEHTANATVATSPLAGDRVHHTCNAHNIIPDRVPLDKLTIHRKDASARTSQLAPISHGTYRDSRQEYQKSADDSLAVKTGTFALNSQTNRTSPRQWVTVPVPDLNGGLQFRPRGFSEDGSMDTSGCSDWDIKNKYLIATRTGPTECPDYILAKHKDYPKGSQNFASPYSIFYFDETAPNNLLLHNDVIRNSKKSKDGKNELPPKKRSTSFDSGANRSTDDYSTIGSASNSSGSTSRGATSTNSKYGHTSENRYDAWTPQDYMAVDKGTSSSSSMSETRFDSSKPGVFTSDNEQVPPVYPPPRGVSKVSGSVLSSITQTKRSRACCGRRDSRYSSITSDMTSSRGYTSNSSKSYTATSSTASLKATSRAIPKSESSHRRSTTRHDSYSVPKENIHSGHRSFSTSYSDGREGFPPTRPSQKRESDRDLSYNIRKMYWDVEDPRVPDRGTGLKMLPTYSVSYRNYPVICYDVVAPKEYMDFFRVRKTPGMYA